MAVVAAAAVVVAVVVGAEREGEMMTMTAMKAVRPLLLALPLALSLVTGAAVSTSTAQEAGMGRFLGAEPAPAFDDPAAAVDAFKAALQRDDFDGVAKLLGLDPAQLKSDDATMATYQKIRTGIGEALDLQEPDADRRILAIGKQAWPLPFPLVKAADGKWRFDTEAGLQEVVNRRIGENEIQAMATLRAYVEAQRDYASEDRDGSGVLKFARKLVSSPGRTDGLYWPPDEGRGESPAGPAIDQAAFSKAKAGQGYFGYRFKILEGQGGNVAGGAYDYVINGNMIAGFAAVAWPVTYDETGVHTFLINQAGIVYEKDLGPRTSRIVRDIRRFNPDKSWAISEE